MYRAIIQAVLLVALLSGSAAAQEEPEHTDPSFCHGLDCPDYDVVETLGSGVELRRYAPSRFVVTDVDELSFEKATVIGFQRLLRYLLGNNENQTKIDMTAPVITLVNLDENNHTTDNYTVALFLPHEYQPVPTAPANRQDPPQEDDWGWEFELDVHASHARRPLHGHHHKHREQEEKAHHHHRRHVHHHHHKDEDKEDRHHHHHKHHHHHDGDGGRGDAGRKGKDRPVPPVPKDERVTVVELDEVDVYVLPFGSYAFGYRAKRMALDFFDFLEENVRGEEFVTDMYGVAAYDPPYRPFNRHNEILVLSEDTARRLRSTWRP